MKEESKHKKENKLKKYFASMTEKLDKKLEEKSKGTKCYGDNSGGHSCCS